MSRAIAVSRWATWLATAIAIVGYAVLALSAAAALTACGGGGDDEPDPNVCYVDGKPMPRKACQ